MIDQLELSDALSVRYNNKVLEMRENGLSPIMLSLGEAFFDFGKEFPSNPIRSGDVHYTHSRGTVALREKVCSFYSDRYNVRLDPNSQLLISAGSKIITFMALKNFISHGSRREVLVPQPAWVSYSEQVKLAGGNVRFLPPDLDVFHLEDFISDDTRVLIICNPHNPTGRNMSPKEIEHLYWLAETRDLVIISDEAYSEFVPSSDVFTSMGAIDSRLSRTIIVNSLSKNFGVSGWRLGFAASNEGVINNLYKINQHLITCAPSILEHYITEYFELFFENAKAQIFQLMEKRRSIEKLLSDLELTTMNGNSTFYFFLRIPPLKGGSIQYTDKLLSDYEVAVVPGIGYGPDCDNFVRISIGAEPLHRIEAGLNAIRDLNLELK